MRLLPTHYVGKAIPMLAKKKAARAEVRHVLPPLNGLSLASKFSRALTEPELYTATILSNFVVEDNSIKVRAGYKKKATRGTAPVWHLLPYYGTPNALAAASNHELWDAQTGNLIHAGFTSDDWHWTAFSNLSQQDFTVAVNGADGVWSWNGGFTLPGTQVNVTAVSVAVAAVVTVASTAGFANGQIVLIEGATSAGGWNVINGNWVISSLTGTTFVLTNVNTSACTGTVNAGVKATPLGSVIKEVVTAPPAETWITPNTFNIVLSHMNRLWFADTSNLAVYYLPLQQKSGLLSVLPLNAIFRRGGSIRAMFTWTVDGGAGMDDLLVIFSTNGECAIYSGTNPDADWNVQDFALKGVFRFDAPMSKHSITQYGGELYVLVSTGLVPLSTMLRAETEQLGQSERNVTSLFLKEAINFRSDQGWQTFLNPSTSRLFCNIPQGADNRYRQLIRHMPKEVWTGFDDIPARCWSWIDPIVYFGDDSGNIYEMHPAYLNDDGKAIRCDVQMAWSDFKSSADKHFTAVTTYLTTNGDVTPFIDVKVDFDFSPAGNRPDIGSTAGGSDWDVARWDEDPADSGWYWTSGERAISIWNGVQPSGRFGAVRMTAQIDNCSLAINGWDVEYELGVFAP